MGTPGAVRMSASVKQIVPVIAPPGTANNYTDYPALL